MSYQVRKMLFNKLLKPLLCLVLAIFVSFNFSSSVLADPGETGTIQFETKDKTLYGEVGCFLTDQWTTGKLNKIIIYYFLGSNKNFYDSSRVEVLGLRMNSLISSDGLTLARTSSYAFYDKGSGASESNLLDEKGVFIGGTQGDVQLVAGYPDTNNSGIGQILSLKAPGFTKINVTVSGVALSRKGDNKTQDTSEIVQKDTDNKVFGFNCSLLDVTKSKYLTKPPQVQILYKYLNDEKPTSKPIAGKRVEVKEYITTRL